MSAGRICGPIGIFIHMQPVRDSPARPFRRFIAMKIKLHYKLYTICVLFGYLRRRRKVGDRKSLDAERTSKHHPVLSNRLVAYIERNRS